MVKDDLLSKIASFLLNQIDVIAQKGFKIILIFIIMLIVIKLSNRTIEKFVQRQIKSNARFSLQPQKAKTIGAVLKSAVKYLTYFVGITIMLSDIFNGVSVALAGVGGVAVGFGTQSLVKDIINGIFILFEDQYGVGDYVTIGKYSGIVESIGIRTTEIKDFSGDIHLIPNGSILEVTNHSKGNIRFIVDVQVAYEENLDNVINIIKKVCNKFEEENEDVVEPIVVFGVTDLAQDGVTIRVMGKSKPLKQWAMENELRKAIKLKLDEENIEIPYRKVQIVNGGCKNG
ncbi:mechanosensitive ion channel family protein [Clostridium sp. HCP1S3_B4]|uniref:mechanosensitive ion channel family protein n=1 Tax=unclassified Clostridium TaxID=2614128 RepID=UPI003F8AAAF1|nr:mechanosensitive ion channel family protein [Clostridiales bacterium]